MVLLPDGFQQRLQAQAVPPEEDLVVFPAPQLHIGPQNVCLFLVHTPFPLFKKSIKSAGVLEKPVLFRYAYATIAQEILQLE